MYDVIYIYRKDSEYSTKKNAKIGAIRDLQTSSTSVGNLGKSNKSGIVEPRRVVYIYIIYY